jgi:hypothetical protein
MQHKMHYATVSEALEQLRKQGFITDFNLEENCIACANGKFDAQSFEIVDVYRYEGNTDPADEATVYAIQSNNGIKGTLVTGYGAYAVDVSPELLKKLR